MKKQRIIGSILFCTFFSIQIYGQIDNSKLLDQEKLEIILRKSAEYCERVKSIALYYVCQEEIKEKTNFYLVSPFMRNSPFGNIKRVVSKAPKIERIIKNSYIYDYQLINKDGEILENRTLLKKNNIKRRQENAKLELRLRAERMVYGPVGFLSQYWQEFFDYKIIGEEDLNHIIGTVIEATPRPNNEDNRNFAHIWVDKEDGSILQIEWQPESITDYSGNQINFQALDIEVNVEWTVTYGIEKNGVRFPDRQQVQEFLVPKGDLRFLQNETIILYNNYKFFIVETEIKYHP